MAPSRISVEVSGVSTSLQEAVAKAADSLKSLGVVLARQTDLALASSQKTVRANELVARSYQQAALSAGGASEKTIAAFSRQGAVALDSSRIQVRASEESATAARLSADEQVKASAATGAASLASATKHEQAARRSVAAFGSSSAALTKAGKTISLGLLGAAAASVDLAVKFQSNTLRMQTQAGATASQLEKLRKGILAMAPAVGQTPTALANGMYHVVSSMNAVLPPTRRVSGELTILSDAAKLATVGHSNLEETTYALASAMNALHAPIAQTGKVTGELNAIVGAGDMTMQDLIDAFKSGLVPGAREAGISLQSLGSALAVMGDLGMRGALAGTRLRMSIALLSSPSAAAAKVLDTLGLSSRQATSTSQAMAKALQEAGLRTTSLSQDLRKPDGIMVALRDLDGHLRSSGLTATGAAAVMSKAFGGGRMGATITLLAQQTDRLDTKFHQIGDTGERFGSMWQKASHTTGFELHSLEGGAASLAVSLGTDLLPAANAVIHDISDVVHWFEKGSGAAHALELSIGTLATVAIGSYLISKLRAAIGLLRELGQVAAHPISSLGGFMRSTAPGAPGGAPITSSLTGGIVGARGPELPGSVANPIIVAIEAGQYAGLSSMGAAGTVATEEKAAAAESGALSQVSRGGAVLPSSAAGAESAAAARGAAGAESAAIPALEAGAGAGILSTLKTGLGALLKAGGLAGVGVLGSQLVGGAIGGKPGKEVASLGTGASIGAGAGTVLLGPGFGTAVGAAAGAAITAALPLFHTQTVGGQAAASLSRGFAGAGLREQVSRALNDARKIQTSSLDADVASRLRALGLGKPGGSPDFTRGAGAFRPLGPSAPAPALSAQQQARMEAEYRVAGLDVARALEAGWNQYRFQSEPIMFRQFVAETRGLPPQARAAAAESAIAFAQKLSQEGKLPAHAAEAMIAQIEQKFPGLSAYMGKSAATAVSAFHASFDLSGSERALNATLGRMRGDFPQVVAAMDSTSGDIERKSVAVAAALKAIVENGTRPMRQLAEADLASLREKTGATFTAMGSKAASAIAVMRSGSSTGFSAMVNDGQAALSTFAENVNKAMGAGALSTGQAMKLIARQTNQVLIALGQRPLPEPTVEKLARTQPGLLPWYVRGTGNMHGAFGPGGPATSATGGFIGSPGERGRDTVPVVLGRGEAVLNHQQQNVANRYLAPLGGLPGLFQHTQGTKHYMAQGGFAGAGTSPLSRMIAQADTINARHYPYLWGGGHNSSFTGPYDCSGAVSAVLHAGGMLGAPDVSGQLMGWGLPGPGEVTVYANPVHTFMSIAGRFFGTHGADGAGWYAGAPAPGFVQRHAPLGADGGALNMVSAPGVNGSGALAGAVRGSVRRAAAAANRFLGQALAGAGGAGGGGDWGTFPHGNIMQIAQSAAAAAGVAWNAAIVQQLLSKESSGGVNEPPSGPLSATGPFQVIPSTFRQYDPAGNITNPADNAIAAMRYIKARYGSLAAMAAATGLLTGGYRGYGSGGFVHAAGGLAGERRKAPKPPRPAAPKPPKLAKTPKGVASGMSTQDLRVLSQIGGKVGAFEGQIVKLSGTYSADSTLFGPQESAAQYLNPDGSLNDAGYARKISDDQTLLGLDQSLLSLYGQEVPVISGALTRYLGEQAGESAQIAADKKTIARNKIREGSIRKAILDLQKPAPDRVGALEGTIAQVRDGFERQVHGAQAKLHGFDDARARREHDLRAAVLGAEGAGPDATSRRLAGALLAAERAKLAYHGPDKATRRRLAGALSGAELSYRSYSLSHPSKNPALSAARQALSTYELDASGTRLSLQDAVQQARESEQEALSPLKTALLGAKRARAARRFKISTTAWHLREQLARLGGQDTRLTQKDAQLTAVLQGAGGAGADGAVGVDPAIALLETVAGKLGTVNWQGGRFAGIDSTMPGEIVSVSADIQALTNDIAQTRSAQGAVGAGVAAAGPADDSALVALLSQQNLALSQTLALNEAQTRVLQGMIPDIPRYGKGGPVLDDGLIYAHRDEYVVPAGGALVAGGAGGAQTFELHQHYHDRAGALMAFIDQRISHPDNVRAISRVIGNRTSMLRGAPGSR